MSNDNDEMLTEILVILLDPQNKLKIRDKNIRCLLNMEQVQFLLERAKNIFLNQPILLELEGPLNICGDIHGQYLDLLWLFECGKPPPVSNYLFLGDYVDRGSHSLETICLLLAYKIRYPKNFFLLRGNHESASISRIYGFYNECAKRLDVHAWRLFVGCFNCLPVAAIVEDRVFCCHGGLSPELHDFDQIRSIQRPTDIPLTGVLCDLLWSDPNKESLGWGINDRGISHTYGPDIVQKFLQDNGLDLLCRAHQVVQKGFEFFANKSVVTIFSAPRYGGKLNNDGAILTIDKHLRVNFIVLRNSERDKYFNKQKSAPCSSTAFPDISLEQIIRNIVNNGVNDETVSIERTIFPDIFKFDGNTVTTENQEVIEHEQNENQEVEKHEQTENEEVIEHEQIENQEMKERVKIENQVVKEQDQIENQEVKEQDQTENVESQSEITVNKDKGNINE